jgi:hypothetical protein
MHGKKMCGSFIEMITLLKGEFVSRGPDMVDSQFVGLISLE